MATLTIRNLDDEVMQALRIRAVSNGRSVSSEARAILISVIEADAGGNDPEEDLGTAIRRRFADIGGVDLPIPPRTISEHPIPFSEEEWLQDDPLSEGLGTASHESFAPMGGVDVQIPTRRKSHRKPPDFSR